MEKLISVGYVLSMKIINLILFTLTIANLLQSASFADQFDDLGDALFDPKLPICSDSLVRLSKEPLDCNFEEAPGSQPKFDIPALELDHIDLQEIFNGAESSGGRLVNPMGRASRPLTPFSFSVSCKASLISDGKKRVSFLSTQSFEMNQDKYELSLSDKKWLHSLMEGNTFEERRRIPISFSPNIDLSKFSIQLTYPQRYVGDNRLNLRVCEQTRDHDFRICSQKEMSLSKESILVELYSEVQNRQQIILKTLRINCQIH